MPVANLVLPSPAARYKGRGSESASQWWRVNSSGIHWESVGRSVGQFGSVGLARPYPVRDLAVGT